jgi:hypothetical protein
LQTVAINLNALDDSTMTVTLPDARSIGLVESKRDVKSATEYTWYGSLVGNNGHATFVVRDGNVVGSIVSGANVYNIVPIGSGLHAIIKVDASRFPPEHLPRTVRSGNAPGPQPAAATGEMNPLPRVDTGPQIIDVLVAYTVSAAYETAADAIESHIQSWVAEANSTYANSDISIELNLVHTHAVDKAYSDAGKSLPAVLADLINRTGALAKVHELRDQFGADLVLLLTGTPDPKSCGEAKTTLADATTAFAVAWQLCAGSPNYALAHELGHLMGAQHDPASDAQDQDAVFTYGHGYQFQDKWRTIMAYNCRQLGCGGGCVRDPEDPDYSICQPACNPNFVCPRVSYWSNPQISYDGNATGTVETSDNASVLRATAATIAGFRNRTPTWSGWEDLGSPQFTLLHGPKCVSAGADTIDCFSNSTYNRLTNDADEGMTCDGNNDDPNRIGCVINAIFTDGVVHHRRWSGGVWSDWQSLDGNFFQTPDCVTAAANRIDCFGMAWGDAGVLHSWTTGDGAWKAWENLAGQSTLPYCLGGTPNRLDCFISADVILYRSWNGTAWSDWQRLPSQQTLWVPDCVRWGSDQLDCFALGRDDGIMYQARKTSAGWSNWTDLGQAHGVPRCFGWGATNRIECFAQDADQTVQHRRWNGTEWSTWQSVDKLAGSPTCIGSGPNRIDCFGRGSDGALWHRWGAGSAWSPWESLGGTIFETPSCVSPASNRIDCFAHGKNRTMVHISTTR